MADSKNSIRISHDDLFSDEVEDFLAVQKNLRQENLEGEPVSLFVKIFYANWFYLSLAGGLGAFLAWAALEPFISDFDQNESVLVSVILFPTVAAGVGLFLGTAEGLMCRNLTRAFISAVVGIGVGFVGGGVLLIPTFLVFGFMRNLAEQMAVGPDLRGMPLLIFMMGRGAAWSIAAMAGGMGQGIATLQWRVVLNGIMGSALGGLLGGLLFDPIAMTFNQDGEEALLSRSIGFTLIGLMVGLFVGLIEGWTKSAWLLMKVGPLAGKQFVLHRESTVLGSAPRCEIYLFKDPDIEPKHAIIHNRGGRFEIEDCGTPDGTYVNGEMIDRRWLKTGDKISLGKTVLEFSVKDVE